MLSSTKHFKKKREREINLFRHTVSVYSFSIFHLSIVQQTPT